MKCKLSDICSFRKGKISVDGLNTNTYISTENMLPNKGGITEASSLPTVPLTQEYRKGDVLVSNIRPYFKKIWKAKYDGGCSNDVLVFAANSNTDKDFLYASKAMLIPVRLRSSFPPSFRMPEVRSSVTIRSLKSIGCAYTPKTTT